MQTSVAILLCLCLFVMGFLTGGILVSIPSLRRALRRRDRGFTEEEMNQSLKMHELTPASSDDTYTYVPEHLD